MRAGDAVVYASNPSLYGPMLIERTLPNGRIVTRVGGDFECEEQFDPQELDYVTKLPLLNHPAHRVSQGDST